MLFLHGQSLFSFLFVVAYFDQHKENRKVVYPCETILVYAYVAPSMQAYSILGIDNHLAIYS